MMIENVTACKNLDKILKIKNLSGIFVGPYDLSASLGVVGEFESKVFKRNIDKIIKTSKKHNKLVGIHVVEPNKKN